MKVADFPKGTGFNGVKSMSTILHKSKVLGGATRIEPFVELRSQLSLQSATCDSMELQQLVQSQARTSRRQPPCWVTRRLQDKTNDDGSFIMIMLTEISCQLRRLWSRVSMRLPPR